MLIRMTEWDAAMLRKVLDDVEAHSNDPIERKGAVKMKAKLVAVKTLNQTERNKLGVK